MKKTTKILLATIIAIIALTTTSKANYQIIYQSNTANYARTNANTFITKLRNMELNGEVMGLYESLEDRNDDLTSNVSNNIDVHLQKNTEYGAMILLSASTKYGKQPSENDTTTLKESRFVGTGTTTGNAYGVYMNESDWTWTAAGVGGASSSSIPASINSKYVNRYSDINARFAGDAVLNWHNGATVLNNNFAIVRWHSGSVYYSAYGYADGAYSYCGRASVVCGEGV